MKIVMLSLLWTLGVIFVLSPIPQCILCLEDQKLDYYLHRKKNALPLIIGTNTVLLDLTIVKRLNS